MFEKEKFWVYDGCLNDSPIDNGVEKTEAEGFIYSPLPEVLENGGEERVGQNRSGAAAAP